MKKLVYWCTLSLLLVSQLVFAMAGNGNSTRSSVSCDFLGQNYTEVLFNVVGTPGIYQEVFVAQGGNKPQVLWYTEEFKEDTKGTEYVFNEQTLKRNVEYQILFVNDVSQGLARYYRRNVTAGNQYWQLLEEKETDLKNGNLTVIGQGEISDIRCESSSIAPELPDVELDICAYVPSSAQTNFYFNGYPSPLSLLNVVSSGNFLYIPEANSELSFANVIQFSDNNCNYNGRQVSCEVDRQLTYDSYPPELEDYDTSDGSIFHDYFCDSNCELKPGKYRNITLGMNAVLTLDSGAYYFNNINFSQQNSQIAIRDNKAAEIHYKSIDFGADNISINSGGIAENLLLIGHGYGSYMWIGHQNININGYVYIDPVALFSGFILDGTNTTISGGVSAAWVNISGGGNHKIGKANNGDCLVPPVEETDYTLVLSPTSDIALVCEGLSPLLSVMSDGALATDFTGTVVVTVDGVSQSYSVSNGSFRQSIPLSTTSSKTISVSAYIQGDQDDTRVTGSYEFVPFKFAADDQYVIANKEKLTTVSTLACRSGIQVDIGYEGTPSTTWSWTAPSSGVDDLTFSPAFLDGTSTDISSGLKLEDSGQVTVTLEDNNFDCTDLDDCPIEGNGTLKGQFTVYSRPWTFAICAADNSSMDGNITEVSSSAFTAAGNAFELYIRPLRWIEGGHDSVPLSGSQDIETSEYCNSPVTHNFFSSDSRLRANVELTYKVSQPSGGADGSLSGTLVHSNTEVINNSHLPFSGLSWSEVGVLRIHADTQADYLGMNVNLGYRDVGRFYPAWLYLVSNEWNYADAHDGFMYMDQPVSYDFIVEAQNLQGGATTNYSEFASDLISNVKLLAVDVENGNEELSDRVEDYSSQLWDDNSHWSGAQLQIEDQGFKFTRSQSRSSPLTTIADGPYAEGFGLRVTTKVDGVDFNTSQGTNLELNSSGMIVDKGKPFPTEQPDIRYGRMVMNDVGGTSVSTIRIPLRTEYWNGARFITNSDDSGSHFVTLNNYICKQSVWSATGDASNATLQGSITLPGERVNDGISQALSATPHSTTDSRSLREQIRFWLRLDDSMTTSPQVSESGVMCGNSYTSQPWLQYNWRKLGDEDPSAVVTFGIHRGNDRIIFRGESNLTGQ